LRSAYLLVVNESAAPCAARLKIAQDEVLGNRTEPGPHRSAEGHARSNAERSRKRQSIGLSAFGALLGQQHLIDKPAILKSKSQLS